MKPINVGIIGVGWCGGIRAETCAINPAVNDLHLVETKPERLAEMAKATNAKSALTDYHQLLQVNDLDAVMISATREALHYPMARDCLEAGLHVFMEKPIAVEMHEADELIAIAKRKNVKFTIGYSQRFNPKYAYVKKCLDDAVIGKPVSAFLKVCSKARNLRTLSLTLGWKRMPPLYGPIALLFCTRQPRWTRIL